jgi:hypothetical protein
MYFSSGNHLKKKNIHNPNNSVNDNLGIKEGHAKMNDKWGGHSRRIEKESS